jgi:hypothetical protein
MVAALALAPAAVAHPLREPWQAMTRDQGNLAPDFWSARDVKFGKREAVPQRPCQQGDRPETGLQGYVPRTDVASGRAAQGYNCNLELVGWFGTPGAGTFEAYRDCAYYGVGVGSGSTLVLDVTDGRTPLATTTLTSTAMRDPWESLRVNAKRGLLVADSPTSSSVDIYDVSGDCRQPRLLSSTVVAPAVGHEGWFSPDGETYFMSTTANASIPGGSTVFPVDISDPAQPKLLDTWAFEAQTHGGSTTEDGSRSYICQQEAPPRDKLLVVDTSRLDEPKLLADVPLGDNQWCQAAYRVTYDGHPYLIQYGERSGAADCSRAGDGWANYGYPRIFDLANERRPKLVSTALLEVSLPEHCQEVTGQGAINGLGYSVHHCSPDRLYDPTILACAWFGGGMRVLDIRDPRRPVELGYYNPGMTFVLGTGARPVVRADRGEIWFVSDMGFYVTRFENGIWPFKEAAPCPEFDDYFYAHYNPDSKCATASFDAIGKPAPGSRRCGGRAATIYGNGVLRGTPGRDVIAGGPGDDTLRGRGGRDLLCGKGGEDVLRGGRGRDTCKGGRRRDRLAGCERQG